MAGQGFRAASPPYPSLCGLGHSTSTPDLNPHLRDFICPVNPQNKDGKGRCSLPGPAWDAGLRGQDARWPPGELCGALIQLRGASRWQLRPL